jgi:GAF domain-containing protein
VSTTKTLAELMADTARQLREHKPEEILLDEAVDAVARDIDPCDAAAISVVRRKRQVETPAASSQEARRADELQYDVGQGPCLDALRDLKTVSSPDLRTDERWPEWGARMSEEYGFRSVAAVQLFTDSEHLGALNLYSRQVSAFTRADIQHAEALAAHLAVAMAAARIIDQLDRAVANRTSIGVATGIVMERYSLDQARGFAVLTRLSSHSNRKLRDIAADIAAGGSLTEAAHPKP